MGVALFPVWARPVSVRSVSGVGVACFHGDTGLFPACSAIGAACSSVGVVSLPGWACPSAHLADVTGAHLRWRRGGSSRCSCCSWGSRGAPGRTPRAAPPPSPTGAGYRRSPAAAAPPSRAGFSIPPPAAARVSCSAAAAATGTTSGANGSAGRAAGEALPRALPPPIPPPQNTAQPLLSPVRAAPRSLVGTTAPRSARAASSPTAAAAATPTTTGTGRSVCGAVCLRMISAPKSRDSSPPKVPFLGPCCSWGPCWPRGCCCSFAAAAGSVERRRAPRIASA